MLRNAQCLEASSVTSVVRTRVIPRWDRGITTVCRAELTAYHSRPSRRWWSAKLLALQFQIALPPWCPLETTLMEIIVGFERK